VLVLTRGPGQSVVLAGDIVITVLSTRGTAVRLGIEAPAGVQVRRAELPHAAAAPAAAGGVRAPRERPVDRPA
jgi:carbon storage regulator